MNICLVEAYATGSHLYFAQRLKELLKENYDWDTTIIATPGRHWRTRLQKGHGLLAAMVRENLENNLMPVPDLFIVTSLTDTAAFRGALPRRLSAIPIIQYMHENQMSYPLNPENPSLEIAKILQDNIIPGYHLNQTLGADQMIFNSQYHLEDFHQQLNRFLTSHGERDLKKSLNIIKEKSVVIPIGLRWPEFELTPFHKRPKRILWNHRWEYDKNPKDFRDLIKILFSRNPHWEISLLGENHPDQYEVEVSSPLEEIKKNFPENTMHFGPLKERDHYFKALSQCRLLPVTSHHDFLGLATLEAILYGVVPLLPNRLVYPELLPQELHEKLLYKNQADLIKKSEQLMLQGLDNQEEVLIRNHLKRFQWSEVIGAWKKILEARMNQINP